MAMLMAALFVGTTSAAEEAMVVAEGSVPAVALSIDDVTSGCENMAVLERGTIVSCSDDVAVTSNADWQLAVEDQRDVNVLWLSFPAAYRGYMVQSEGFMMGPYTRITYPLILDIGSVDENLREEPCMVKSDGAAQATGEVVNVPYSQQVSGSEVTGDYSIELTYILSARV